MEETKRVASIYDLKRMCEAYSGTTLGRTCTDCPLFHYDCDVTTCGDYDRTNIDVINEIILKWVDENPVKTRQSEFLKMFPNALITDDGYLSLCPNDIDRDYIDKKGESHCRSTWCSTCMRKFWLSEIK